MLEYQRVHPEEFVELLNAATGLGLDFDEFTRTGERICNLTRLFNLRRGITGKDDTIPARILIHKRGSGDSADNLPNLDAMLKEYYSYRKWDTSGIPTKEKLTELQLDLYGI